MEVKENPGKLGVSAWWVVGGVGAALLQLLLVVSLNERLPAPRPHDAPPHQFSAARAHRHLLDLTNLGPRVAGSYENEVLAVRVATQALAGIAAGLGAHHALDVDVFRYDGNYSITFLDGMSTAYRSVVGVVARLRGAGARPTSAALLNCHLDSVPDSPGAHDDALGCAVALETLRALGAASRPHRHDTLLLLNGAEENIMQASHAFLTQHPWAKHARVFVNIEACGAGGRELLFRATHDYWLLQEYAQRAPYPFLASLAQEVFEWGLVPADTDYRIFAQHNLSGVDLAWVAEGYAYHTRLDSAERVELGGLQRTGDNVLSLVEGILMQRELTLRSEQAGGGAGGAPLYFDVLGLWGVVLSAAEAGGVAVLLLLAAAALTNYQVPPHLRDGSVWAGLVARCAARVCASAGAGGGAAALSGVLLAVLDARMLAHARPYLLLLQAALPAVLASWCTFRYLQARERLRPLVTSHRALLATAACRCVAAVCVLVAVLCGLRSGVLPAVWLLGWCVGPLGAMVAALYWVGAARDLLSFVLPASARAAPHTHPDIFVMVLAGFAAVVAVSWLLPTVLAADNINKVLGWLFALYACSMAWCVLYAWHVGAGAAYSSYRPQRHLAIQTRAGPVWMPHLDLNSHKAHALLFPGPLEATNCSALFCSAPYFLPAMSLVPRGAWAERDPPPPDQCATLHVHVDRDQPEPHLARVNLTLLGEKHIVVIVSPCAGCSVPRLGPVEEPARGPAWGTRPTYMLTLFDARPRDHRTPWHVPIHIQVPGGWEGGDPPLVSVWAAGHAMSGRRAKSPALRDAEGRAPDWLALTSWTADMHYIEL